MIIYTSTLTNKKKIKNNKIIIVSLLIDFQEMSFEIKIPNLFSTSIVSKIFRRFV